MHDKDGIAVSVKINLHAVDSAYRYISSAYTGGKNFTLFSVGGYKANPCRIGMSTPYILTYKRIVDTSLLCDIKGILYFGRITVKPHDTCQKGLVGAVSLTRRCKRAGKGYLGFYRIIPVTELINHPSYPYRTGSM